MHIDLNEIIFVVIFIVYNAFMMSIVEGLIPKLFFLAWIISVLCCGIYIVIERDKPKPKF